MRALMRAAALALATALAAPAGGLGVRPAWADEDPDLTRAKQHFRQGEKLFALGRFADALVAYEAAFEAKPLPAFLFNIGQCHRNLGDYRSAIFSFRKYLRLDPDATNRAAVEQLIAELEAELEAADRLDRQRRGNGLVEEPPPPDERRPVYTRWWFWTGAVALAAAGTATVILVSDRGGVPTSTLGNVDFP